MAAEAEHKITPEELASWWTPMQACGYAANCVGADGARAALWELLRAGLIEAVANSASLTPYEKSPITTNKPSFIPKDRWDSFFDTGSDFWKGGYARFYLVRGHLGQSADYRAFGIKLNPDDVRANLPSPRSVQAETKPSQTPSETQQSTEAEPQESWPPVSDAHLNVWYELYRQVYTGATDTEDMALKSARGMFPGKSVSRAKIRTLRGAQKIGRKSKDG